MIIVIETAKYSWQMFPWGALRFYWQTTGGVDQPFYKSMYGRFDLDHPPTGYTRASALAE